MELEIVTFCHKLNFQLKIQTHNLTEKMYAYYVEVPIILISESYFHFIPPVEFLDFFSKFLY